MLRTVLAGSLVVAVGLLGSAAYAQQRQGQQGGTMGQQQGGTTTQQRPQGARQLSAADQRFAMGAAHANRAEIALGQLAQQHGSSDAVKNFGKRMAVDHKKVNDELEAIAKQKGLTLPDSLSRADEGTQKRLSSAPSDRFDREYMQHMVAEHQKDVAEYRRGAATLQDPDLKRFAQKTLPTLEDHLRQAEAIRGQEKIAAPPRGGGAPR